MEDLKKRFVSLLKEKRVFTDRVNVVVLFSGGKDCSVLLHLLGEVATEVFKKISLHPVMVLYPRHM